MDVSILANALVVAVEPDADQASKVALVVRDLVGANLIIGDSARAVLAAITDRVPDLILTSPLLPPGDEAIIAERLQPGAHVQVLTIPLLGALDAASRSTGLLSRLQRGRTGTPSSCPPETFAHQVRGYLEQASAERQRQELRPFAARAVSIEAAGRRLTDVH